MYTFWWCWNITKFLRNLLKKMKWLYIRKPLGKVPQETTQLNAWEISPRNNIFFFMNYDFCNISIWFLNEDDCNARKKVEISNIYIHLHHIRHTNLIFKIWKYVTQAVIRSALKRGTLKILPKSFKDIYQGTQFLIKRKVCKDLT